MRSHRILRIAGSTEDRGSLPLVMLLSLVSASLGALLLPALVSQNGSTREDVRRVHALHAAQTGIDVAVGQIRAASSSSGTGDPSLLPCPTSANPITGTVAADNANYSVAISYYATNPVVPGGATAPTALACPQSTLVVPGFALLKATGTTSASGQTATRTISATYKVAINYVNVAGGHIMYNGLCVDAPTPQPSSAPATLRLSPCVNNSPEQSWAYTPDLGIQLVSTVGDHTGLCIDAGSTTPRTTSTPVGLEPCLAGSDVPIAYKQEWKFIGGNFASTVAPDWPTYFNSANTRRPQLCLGGSTFLALVNCPAYVSLDATVGAGKANANTLQYVNYKQFGRCLDVNASIIRTSRGANPPISPADPASAQAQAAYGQVITWPCTQVPSGVGPFNEHFTYVPYAGLPGYGFFEVEYSNPNNPPGNGNDGGAYCLNAYPANTSNTPVPLGTSIAPGGQLYVFECPNTNTPVDPGWLWATHIGRDYPYATQATITSAVTNGATGWCLTTGPILSNGTGVVGVAACDGSAVQKWNGDPNKLAPFPLQNVAESNG